MRSFFPILSAAAAAVATLSASPLTHAFIAPTTSSNVVVTIRSERCNYSQLAAIKHDEDFLRDDTTTKHHHQQQQPSNNNNNLIHKSIASTFVATAVLFGTALSPTALAVSGGGSDYAGLDISTQDLSNGSEYILF